MNGDNTLTSSDTSPRVPAKARLSRLRQVCWFIVCVSCDPHDPHT